MLRIIIIISNILFIESKSFSQDEYFLTLRYNKVNLRQGPSREYPVKILYEKTVAMDTAYLFSSQDDRYAICKSTLKGRNN